MNEPRIKHLNLDHTTVVTSSDQLSQHDQQVALVMQEFEGRHLTPIVRTTAVTETVEGRTSVILVTTITR